MKTENMLRILFFSQIFSGKILSWFVINVSKAQQDNKVTQRWFVATDLRKISVWSQRFTICSVILKTTFTTDLLSGVLHTHLFPHRDSLHLEGLSPLCSRGPPRSPSPLCSVIPASLQLSIEGGGLISYPNATASHSVHMLMSMYTNTLGCNFSPRVENNVWKTSHISIVQQKQKRRAE